MGEKRYGYLDASPENLSTRGLKIIVAAYSIGSVRSRSKQEVASLSFFLPRDKLAPRLIIAGAITLRSFAFESATWLDPVHRVLSPPDLNSQSFKLRGIERDRDRERSNIQQLCGLTVSNNNGEQRPLSSPVAAGTATKGDCFRRVQPLSIDIPASSSPPTPPYQTHHRRAILFPFLSINSSVPLFRSFSPPFFSYSPNAFLCFALKFSQDFLSSPHSPSTLLAFVPAAALSDPVSLLPCPPLPPREAAREPLFVSNPPSNRPPSPLSPAPPIPVPLFFLCPLALAPLASLESLSSSAARPLHFFFLLR